MLAATQLLTPGMGVVRATQVAGLLYVRRNIVQVLASYPVGAAADRLGHRQVLVAGYVLGLATATPAALAFSVEAGRMVALVLVFFVAGLYTAVQEALEPTVTAEMVGAEVPATSSGALGTVNGTAKLISSSAVGLLWTTVSPVVGFALAAAMMTMGTLVLAHTR